MHRWIHGAAALALVALPACGGGGLRPGDTVTPQLDSPIEWTAGKPGQIFVRLVATDRAGAARGLDFDGIPDHVNPVASVQFFGSDYQFPDVRVELGQRCCDGLYKIAPGGIDVPAGVRRARVVIAIGPPAAGVAGGRLEREVVVHPP